MSSANSKQIGGTHYKTGGPEHWDLIDAFQIPYIEGCASKYVCRWRRKDGVIGLEKSVHFVEKRLESMQRIPPRIRSGVPQGSLETFYGYDRTDVQDQYLLNLLLLRLYDKEALEMYLFQVKQMLAEHTPGSPADGGHHSNQVG
jgi:hypothetical protein